MATFARIKTPNKQTRRKFFFSVDKLQITTNSHLHRFVEDAAANLDHLQVLFLFVPGALDVGHPAALVLLAGIDEVAHRSILVEHLTETHRRTGLELGSTRDGELGDVSGIQGYGLTSHIRLLFFSRSTCSGDRTLPVKGPISVPALIQVLEKMPSPSPGIELWAMITSLGSTRLDNFCTSVDFIFFKKDKRKENNHHKIPIKILETCTF